MGNLSVSADKKSIGRYEKKSIGLPLGDGKDEEDGGHHQPAISDQDRA